MAKDSVEVSRIGKDNESRKDAEKCGLFRKVTTGLFHLIRSESQYIGEPPLVSEARHIRRRQTHRLDKPMHCDQHAHGHLQV